MILCLGYHNAVRFNSIPAVRIQSRSNPLQICHCRTNNPQNPSVEYLRTSLGFSPESAPGIIKLFGGFSPKNPDAVLTFFRSRGVSESGLRLKIQFLRDKGISEPDIMELMGAVPHFFTRSLNGYIKPLLHLLSSVLGSHESAVQLLIRYRRSCLFSLRTCSSNVALLRSYGVEDRQISRLLRHTPLGLRSNSVRFCKKLEMVKEMGFKPESGLFIDAIGAITSLSSQTWDAKIKLYTTLGWSADEVMSLFRKQPGIMKLSEKKIRKQVKYLMKELGWSPSCVLRNPNMLRISLEERIIPRHRFLQFLASRDLIEKNVAHSFLMSNEKFCKYFIKYEQKVPNVLQICEVLTKPKQLNTEAGEDHVQ